MQIWYQIVLCGRQSHGRYKIFLSSKDRLEKNVLNKLYQVKSRRTDYFNLQEQNSSDSNGYGNDTSIMIYLFYYFNYITVLIVLL